MKHGSLFSGIGGFDLAAQWIGWDNVFHCEIDKWNQKLLKEKYPQSISYGDIETTSFIRHRGLDVLSGGWPCQGNSRANQSEGPKGLEHDTSRLFFEFARAIEESEAKYVVAENVADVLKINNGRDFHKILRSLSSMGYNAEWRVCYSSDEGAPHKRARLFTVAYPGSVRLQKGESFFRYVSKKERKTKLWNIAGADRLVRGFWEAEPPVLRMDDGVSDRLHRIKGLGNTANPHTIYKIFKAIDYYENQI